MAFTPFSDLSNQIDLATATFITSYSGKMIASLAPVATTAVTMYIVLFGFSVMRGVIHTPLSEFIWTCIRISVITTLALNVGIYQGDIANVIRDTPNDLTSALTGNAVGSYNSVIDNAAVNGFNQTKAVMEKAPGWTSPGTAIACWFMAALVFLATVIMVVVGAAWILLSKVAISVLLGVGPLFIFALLFKPTARFFDSWLGQVLNYVFLIILVSAVCSFMFTIFGNFVADIKIDPDSASGMDAWAAVGQVLIIGLTSVLILWQLPGISSGLAGGSSVSGGGIGAAMVGAAASKVLGGSKKKDGGDKEKKGGGNVSNNSGGGTAYKAGRVAGQGARMAGRAASAAKNHFRKAVA